ncbi:hypothetical protein D3C85_1505510 [compost metagenome]
MTLPGQMELATVIDHKPRPIRAKELGITYEAFCASSGRQLAKMLSQYDDSPSSQLWSDIQRLAREILK